MGPANGPNTMNNFEVTSSYSFYCEIPARHWWHQVQLQEVSQSQQDVAHSSISLLSSILVQSVMEKHKR
jgi:hypothetical protein